MDVPFISSGAMSRTQYALVRKIENAATPQAADQILLHELDSVRHNLQQPHLSIKDCKECLILILHCTMSLTTAGPGDLEFAFPHAVNLAELGQSPMDKKIGYMFCAELMPPNHELQLMLVNTLRKDLESSSVARMCLALDVLTQAPSEDVIPAVDARLQTLLEHQSVVVQRRALMAYYALFRRDPERLSRLDEMLQHRLLRESVRSGPTLTVAGKLKHSESLGKLLNSQLQHRYHESGETSAAFAILRTLRKGEMKLDPGSVPIVFDIIKRASKVPIRAVLRDAFLLLSTVSPETLRESPLSSIAVANIRHFLSSRDPNDLFLFVSCLSCLDPSIWAGMHPNTVAVLDEWEVQAVMRLLHSPDELIRKTTLKVLHAVDPNIVEAYYSQAVRSFSSSYTLSDKNEYVSRLLEVVDMQEADDAEQYIRHLKDLFSVVEGAEHGPTEGLPVLEPIVERILKGIRQRETSSRISCVTALAVSLTETEVRVGPTLMVVVSALVSEYCGKISIPPVEMLHGIATRLGSYVPSVQDACVLTMLRLSVECEEVPEQVTVAVRQLSQHTSAYLRKRCTQFLTLSSQRRILAEIVSRAPSSSLPDFLLALSRHQSSQNGTPSESPRATSSGRPDLLEFSPTRETARTRRLRYEAYAAPQPVTCLRYLSSPRRGKGLVSSRERGTRSSSRASDGSNSLNELAKTITPGELTLTAAQNQPYLLESSGALESAKRASEDELSSRVDLITLDSPFPTELGTGEGTDFRVVWDSMENANVRGWCEAPLDTIVRVLQSLQYRMRVIAADQPPFEGELKVLIQGPGPGQHAALRLREEEEEEDQSCLWRLRCDEAKLRTLIRRLIEQQ